MPVYWFQKIIHVNLNLRVFKNMNMYQNMNVYVLYIIQFSSFYYLIHGLGIVNSVKCNHYVTLYVQFILNVMYFTAENMLNHIKYA